MMANEPKIKRGHGKVEGMVGGPHVCQSVAYGVVTYAKNVTAIQAGNE